MTNTKYAESAADAPVHEDASRVVAAEPDVEKEQAAAPYVHPEAAALFARLPWMQHIPLFGQSATGFGPKATFSLGSCYFLNKGLGSYLVSYSKYAMFRSRFGIDGTRYQRLSTLYTMGWSVKAFSACMSDMFALLGYTKRWYCAGSCVVGAAFTLAFGLLPAKVQSANTGAGFMFLGCFCMANVDILSEGHYSRILRRRPDSGPALVSWIWVFIFVAALIAAVIQGPLSDNVIPQVGLYISAGAQLVTVFFFIFNWYGERYNKIERYEDFLKVQAEKRALEDSRDSEADPTSAAEGKNLHPELSSDHDHTHTSAEKAAAAAVADVPQSHSTEPHEQLSDELVQSYEGVPGEEEYEQGLQAFMESPYMGSACFGALEVNKEVFFRNWRLFVYSAIMVAAVVAQCLVTVFGTSHDLGWSSLAVAVTCCSVAFWACRLVVAKAIVFVFLDMVLYISVTSVLDSFYMAKESCLPDGPHFTYTFYTTVGSIIGNLAGIAGVTAFAYLFSKHSYCMTFVVTTLIKVVSSVFDIVIVKRWNLYVGIPDHAMYLLGDAIVFDMCKQLAWMPVVLLFSRVCPRGSESIIYALTAGFSNMGQSIAGTIGSLFIELVWPIKTTGVNGCDFSNVPMLLLVSHILIPLAVIPLSFLLLPRARVCDDLDVDGHVVKHEAAAPEKLDGASSQDEERVAASGPAEPIHQGGKRV